MSTQPTATPEIVQTEETHTAGVRDTVAFTDFPAFFDRSFPLLAAAIAAQGRTVTGPAFARYRGEFGESADIEVGLPLDRALAQDGEVTPGALPAGRVARLVHAGSFDGLPEAWGALRSWVEKEGLPTQDTYWEVYVTEPTPEMDPADLRTELNWPLA